MKTLLFTLEYPPFQGGVANYYGNLVKYWPAQEKIDVLDNSKSELLVKGRKFFVWCPAISAFQRKINKSKATHILVGQILPLGTIVYFWSFFKSYKYTVFLHGMDLSYALKNRRKRFIASLILKKADKIICANSYVAEKVREFNINYSDKIRVVNPGVEAVSPVFSETELSEIKNYYNLPDDAIILFSLGRLVKRKGFDRTIKALSLIPEPILERLTYFIAGIGPEEEYLKKLVPKELINKVVFLGAITNDDKWTWLSVSSIFVMPSRDIAGDYEGFGIVYLEANLAARPVIAGESGGVKDAVIDGYNGLIVNSENVYEISEAIIKLVENPDLREKLGKQGQVRAIDEFNWEKQVASVFQILNETD